MRGLHSADPQCAICTHPEGLRVVAAHEFGDHVPAAYPNPEDEHGQWFHGTNYDPKNGDLKTADERGEDHTGWRHWNTHLGTHFTSIHDTAKEFASRPLDQTHARIAHASLHMESPLHYRSENEMTDDAFRWARKNGFKDYETHTDGQTGKRRVEEYDESPEDHRYLNKDIIASSSAEGWLQGHPRIGELAHGFKKHLQSMGFDGITYGNEHEKPIGHTSAIAFKETPVKIHQWEKIHAPADRRKTAMGMEGPDYDNLTYQHHRQDNGDEMLTAHHPEHGQVGKITYADMEHEGWTGFPARAIHINMLRVHPEHRRRGVATQLMSHLEDRYRDVPIDHGTRTRMGEAWGRQMYGRDSKPGRETMWDDQERKPVPIHYVADWTLNGKPWNFKNRKYLPAKAKESILKQGEINTPHSREELIAHAEGHQTLYKPTGEQMYGPGLCGAHALQLEKERQTKFKDFGIEGMDEDKPEHRWESVGKGSCGTCTRHQNEWINRLPGGPSAPLDGPRPSPESRPRKLAPNHVPFDPNRFHGLASKVPDAALPPGYSFKTREDPQTERWGLPALHVDVHHENGKKPVGSLSVHQRSDENGGTYGVPNIYVDPEHQRKGLGTAMYGEIHRHWPDIPIEHSEYASESAQALNRSLKSRFGPSLHTSASLDLHQVRVLNPTTGFDPYLFDGEKLKSEIRTQLVGRWRNFCAQHQLRDWMGWAQLYFTGGEASEWSGPGSNPNGDFDMQVGIDFDDFREANPGWKSLTNPEISAKLNNWFRSGANDHYFHVDDRDFDLTWYSNPAVNPKIENINPYAAYDVLGDKWAVHPKHYKQAPHLPAAVRKALEGAETYARQVLSLPEPQRTREAAALFESWHNDRSKAFEPGGKGVFDYANLRMKALEATGTWQQLQDAANRLSPRKAANQDVPYYHATYVRLRPGARLQTATERGHNADHHGPEEAWRNDRVWLTKTPQLAHRWAEDMGKTPHVYEIRPTPDVKRHTPTPYDQTDYDLGGGQYHAAGGTVVRKVPLEEYQHRLQRYAVADRGFSEHKLEGEDEASTVSNVIEHVRHLPHEEHFVINPRGKITSHLIGHEDEVDTGSIPDKVLRGSTTVHNHPGSVDWPHSENDVVNSLAVGERAAHVVTKSGVHTLRITQPEEHDEDGRRDFGTLLDKAERIGARVNLAHGEPEDRHEIEHHEQHSYAAQTRAEIEMMARAHPKWMKYSFVPHQDRRASLNLYQAMADRGFSEHNRFLERLDKGPEEEPYLHGRRDEYAKDITTHTGHQYTLMTGTHIGYGGDTQVTAHRRLSNGKYQGVGYLSWFGGKPEERSGSNIDPGTIYKVHVAEQHRRRGVASAMLDFARERYPEMDIRHSNALSEDGRAWAEKKASYGEWARDQWLKKVDRPRPDGTEWDEKTKQRFHENAQQDYDLYEGGRYPKYQPGEKFKDYEGNDGPTGWVKIEHVLPYAVHHGTQHSQSPEIVKHLREEFEGGKGVMSSLDLHYWPEGHEARLGEGNHRLEAMRQAGWSHVPVSMKIDQVRQRDHNGDDEYTPAQFPKPKHMPEGRILHPAHFFPQEAMHENSKTPIIWKHSTLVVEHRHWGGGLDSLFPSDEDGPKSSAVAPWQAAGQRKDVHTYDKELVGRSITHPHEFPIEEVDPRDLRATQPKVLRAGVKHYMENGEGTYGENNGGDHRLGNDIPRIYHREDGQKIILTGHHRAAAALLKGEKLRAMVIHGGWGQARNAA